jgi:uncharacterized protein YbbC (DUF1343 family)
MWVCYPRTDNEIISRDCEKSASLFTVRVGLDRLCEEEALRKRVRGRKLGLLAHPASMGLLNPFHPKPIMGRSLLHAGSALRIVQQLQIIFGPEHGYGGEAQDMIGVADARDADGTPVRSLYGERFSDLTPRDEDLRGLDLLVIDLQDVGARYYTFVWTAVLAMRACAKNGVGVLVLDRPNPLGGVVVEGRRQRAGFTSFVGLEPIPVRHGLTIGEIVAWRAEVEGVAKGQVEVVRVHGLERAGHAPAWDRPFVMPSPNMPTYETALVYPGGCLLEGTNLSDGRGTTRPFEITGAPWIDGIRLANDLNVLGLAGFTARPLTFRPTFHKHEGQTCGGVQIHVTDPRAFPAYATYLALITLARGQAPDRFRFRTERYEFVDDVPAFDLLTGSADARERILAGGGALEVAESLSIIDEEDRAIVAHAVSAGSAAGI